MRTLMHLTLASCLVGAATGAAQAQQDRGPLPECRPSAGWTKFEDETVQKLIALWQRTDNDTVRHKVASTLQQMGAEVSPALGCALAREFNEALAKPGERQKHLETIQLLAGILGRQGNSVSREVRQHLMAVATRSETMPAEVRQAAIEALGKIFANRSVFLILNRETFWIKEYVRQPTPREMVEFLKNETATLTEKFYLAKLPNPEKARELILDTRNVGRKIRSYRNVIALLSELEEPQEKDLATRINLDLADIESNLQMVAAPEKQASAQAAMARAEQKARELHEEMEHVGDNVWRWQALNQGTSEVIAALRELLADPQPLIQFAAAEALGRIYGKLDW